MKYFNKKNRIKIQNIFMHEAFVSGIGWFTGLLSVQFVASIFEKSSVWNLWGYWSDKMVFEERTFNIIEWLISAIIGFTVMSLVKLIISKSIVKYNEYKSIQNP
jgi:hypothetical protein